MSEFTQERWVVKDGPLGTYVHDRLTGRDMPGHFTTPDAARDWIKHQRERYITAVANLSFDVPDEGLCLAETRAPDSRVLSYCRLPAGHRGPHQA